jgi:ABC-type transport system substrate-binding protein
VLKAIVAPVAALALLVTGGSAAAEEPPPTTLRVELRADIDYVDPALAYYVPTWTIMYATCAKLVNYPDLPAPEGGQLQPEVASAMPTISADGKTYTFELRDDFVFSPPSNESVTAAHFKWAIDRALNRQMNSPAQPFFEDIVGAEDVIAGTTNSTSGVVAEGNTLRITLVRPIGDFLARLAMPFSCPLPLSVPVQPGGIDAPVPSAGPYYIAGWTRNQELLIKENPNYAGERPHHFDEIHYGIGLPLETIKLGIDAGTTDWGDVPPAAHDELALRFGPCAPGSSPRPRYLCYPAATVLYLAMNHDRPLFGAGGPRGNVDLKRAVNYAIDRAAMIEQRGANAATPTDQHLPFLVPGFQDEDIYPMQPDLAKARQLAGCDPDCPPRQGVFYCSNAAPAPQICAIVQANLREIGLEMEIKLFPRAMQFTLTGRRGEPFDMTFEGWHMDYLDPYGVLFAVDGATIRPANNTNFAYFNDPEYNQRIAEANQLHGAAREAAFGQLDVDIARNAAPWAAYGIPNDRFYFSDRVGCQIYSPHYTINLAALCLRPAISILDASVVEGDSGAKTATFTVGLSEELFTDYPITLSYATADGTAGPSDYEPSSGTITFEAGEHTKTIAVDIVGDTAYEDDETFAVALSGQTKGTIVRSAGIGTIQNDDAAPPPPAPAPPPPSPPPPAPPPPAPPSPPPPPARAQAPCVVPDVRRRTVAEARRVLVARRCALGRVARAYSAKVKLGRAISQSRRPGARLPRGTRVNVVVSRGRRR